MHVNKRCSFGCVPHGILIFRMKNIESKYIDYNLILGLNDIFNI